jgi:hypothetical protein
MTLRCGRLDRHEPHEWKTPHSWGTYQCAGHVITEMERTRFDAEDDAAEERAIVERRES